MALGAAQAVANANLQNVLIVGFDGDKAGLQAVKDGTLDATMVQKTQEMGRLSVQSACDLATGKQVPPTQMQSATLLTKDDPDKAQEFINTHP